MKTRPLFLVLCLLAATIGSLFAEKPEERGGVTISLSTSRYIVRPITDPTAVVPNGKGTAVFPTFSASVALHNRTPGDIEFAFPSADAAKRHFVFRIFDATGKQLWVSEPPTPLATPALFHDTLEHKSSWKLSALIPLLIDGKVLDLGTYTLEASIDGLPEFTAVATFKVAAPVVEPSGIRGLVLAGPVSPVSHPGEPNEKPVPKAVVTYYNALAASAVVTTVIADEQGRFGFSVPPGEYIVAATIPGDEHTSFGHDTKKVKVLASEVTRIVFHLDTGIR